MTLRWWRWWRFSGCKDAANKSIKQEASKQKKQTSQASNQEAINQEEDNKPKGRVASTKAGLLALTDAQGSSSSGGQKALDGMMAQLEQAQIPIGSTIKDDAPLLVKLPW